MVFVVCQMIEKIIEHDMLMYTPFIDIRLHPSAGSTAASAEDWCSTNYA